MIEIALFEPEIHLTTGGAIFNLITLLETETT